MAIEFRTHPDLYRHWQMSVDGSVATLAMDVAEDGGLFDGYPLKLNSYDLGVDIELFDAITRLRFESPQVSVVLLRSSKDNVFCAGANIRMLAGASHGHKVNFCKFTNETRCTLETASQDSGQFFVTVIEGACAGGGYELALATDYILLADDSSSSVSLPEVPLLAVLPGTGGLTRVTDKRQVRRDLADVFCTLEEGVKGQRAVDWKLVDATASPSKLESLVSSTVGHFVSVSKKTGEEEGVTLRKIQIDVSDDDTRWAYSHLDVLINNKNRTATLTLKGPTLPQPLSIEDARKAGSSFWLLALVRELDHALLSLRFNRTDIGVLIFKSLGDIDLVTQYMKLMFENKEHWFANEVLCYWTRALKRIDMTSKSLVALIEPGSCFAGSLFEVVLACDRSYMLLGQFDDQSDAPDRADASVKLMQSSFGDHLMGNGLSRLESRFLNDDASINKIRQYIDMRLETERANELGLLTFAYDDIDWEDEIRLFLEERSSFSADALTAMEANLRVVGPETMETRIFGRLTAWQNWVFQRPNAVGEAGALQRYGTGIRGEYDQNRV